MIDSFKPKIGVTNDPRRLSGLPKTVTMVKAIAYINTIKCEEEVKKRLIRKIGSYPANTLGLILKNINEIITRVREEMSDEKKKKDQKPEEKKNDHKPEEKKKDDKGHKPEDDKKPESKDGKKQKPDDKSDKKDKPEEQKPRDPKDRQDERHDALEEDLNAGQSGVDRRRGHVPDENGQPIDLDGGAGPTNTTGGLDHRLPDPAYPLRGEPSPDPIEDRGLQVDP